MLETEGLTMRFGGLTAVSDFNITIEKNEIVGLIGPNGAGKTTAFNLITGVYRPSAGKILYKGRDITGLKPHVPLRRIELLSGFIRLPETNFASDAFIVP